MAEHISDRMVKDLQPPAAGNRIVYDEVVKGFGVRVTAAGAKAFVLSYRFDDPGAGRRSNEYRHTIGAYPAWSVAAARDEAKTWKQKIDRGETHPLAEKRGRRQAVQAAREAETYEEAVVDYVTREQIGRRKNATAKEVKRALLRDGAKWKSTAVSKIAATDIRKLLEGIRDGREGGGPRPYLANRMHAYLSAFFRWCAEPGVEKVAASPMVGMRRPWDGEEVRDRVYSDDELRAIWKATEKVGSVVGAFVRVAMLSGKRRGALSAMRWNELSEEGVWTPPVDLRRRKRNKRVHAVPLPALAMRVIRPLRPPEGREGVVPYVFAGRIGGTHIVPGTPLQKEIRDHSKVGDFMLHGLRHTVETKLAELGIAPHIRDLLLDHAPARGAGAGYDHHHYGKEMRAALEAWAGYVEKLVAPKGVKVLR